MMSASRSTICAMAGQQAADFIVALGVHAHGQIAVGQRIGGGDRLLNRRQHHPAQHQHQQRQQGDGDAQPDNSTGSAARRPAAATSSSLYATATANPRPETAAR